MAKTKHKPAPKEETVVAPEEEVSHAEVGETQPEETQPEETQPQTKIAEVGTKVKQLPEHTLMIFDQDKFYNDPTTPLYNKDTVYNVPNAMVDRWIKRGGKFVKPV